MSRRSSGWWNSSARNSDSSCSPAWPYTRSSPRRALLEDKVFRRAETHVEHRPPGAVRGGGGPPHPPANPPTGPCWRRSPFPRVVAYREPTGSGRALPPRSSANYRQRTPISRPASRRAALRDARCGRRPVGVPAGPPDVQGTFSRPLRTSRCGSELVRIVTA